MVHVISGLYLRSSGVSGVLRMRRGGNVTFGFPEAPYEIPPARRSISYRVGLLLSQVGCRYLILVGIAFEIIKLVVFVMHPFYDHGFFKLRLL